MNIKEIQHRLDRGYTMAVYGTRENIHEQMNNDIKMLLKAINYTRSCETLKDKETISFDEWLNKWNWKQIGNSYVFKREESYTDAESLMISYKKEYNLYCFET